VWRLLEMLYQRQNAVPPRAFPAPILLILGIGTGAVQGRTQNTRLGAGFSIGNWAVLSILGGGADFCRSSPPRLLCSHLSEGGELELRYVTYYVSKIYKERKIAFPTELGYFSTFWRGHQMPELSLIIRALED